MEHFLESPMKALATRTRSHRVHTNDNVPSPEKIREMTAEIRKTWTSLERRRRASLARYVELVEMPLTPHRKGYWTE
jgi:hypothetical protein